MIQRTLTVTAAAADADERLDKFLAARLPELSRARLQALLEAGAVTRDGVVITEPSCRVKPGQRFALGLPEPVEAEPKPEAIPLDVLYEDDHLLVLDKPAGLVVHPAPGHAGGTLVNALLGHCASGAAGALSGIGGVLRPGIVHRLDKDASGLMVVAKDDRAHVRLAAQFSAHSVERVYEAIVWGLPPRPAGTIERPIGRHPKDRKRMAVVEGGKRALTQYRLEAAAGRLAARLRLTLGTGRTHQIRVHLGALGLGIVGDPVYRPRRRPALSPALKEHLAGFKRIALHARILGFEHPVSGAALRFERPAPACFERLFAWIQEDAAGGADSPSFNHGAGTLRA
jgi:23S rRNA pseudouridine1911/1915/1917 synthase